LELVFTSKVIEQNIATSLFNLVIHC